MSDTAGNGKADRPEMGTAGTKYPAERLAMLDVVRARRKYAHRSQVVQEALDDLLRREGLLDKAA